MNSKDKLSLNEFLDNDRKVYAGLLEVLFKKLSCQMDFRIKILKASVQLVCGQTFAVIGFRKKNNSMFIEFYSDNVIESARISKTFSKNASVIIHTVAVSSEKDIDEELISFIKHSYTLIAKAGEL